MLKLKMYSEHFEFESFGGWNFQMFKYSGFEIFSIIALWHVTFFI